MSETTVTHISAHDMSEARRRQLVLSQLGLAWGMAPHLRLGELLAAASWLASRDRDPGQIDDQQLVDAALEFALGNI